MKAESSRGLALVLVVPCKVQDVPPCTEQVMMQRPRLVLKQNCCCSDPPVHTLSWAQTLWQQHKLLQDLEKSIHFPPSCPDSKCGQAGAGGVQQRASKSLFSSAKESALFKADSIKGRGCYLEEPLCLHFKGPVLLLGWSCFMQFLNEKHLFAVIPQQQIRFSQDSLTVWESFCDCPDFCRVIEITTLTSALSNVLLKENTKKIQIYYRLTGFITPA